MSNSTCHFSPAKNRTESDMPTGGISDVSGYPCKRWQDVRGCRIEHDAAVAYGLDVMEE